MCFAAPCEFTGGGGGDKKSCGVACSSGHGTPYLTLDGMAVRISDTPIWFDTMLGPTFQFTMFYDTTDGRSRSNETWPVGYRWQHDYDCHIDAAGTNRYLQVGGGRSYRFCDNGQGVFTERMGPGEAGLGGQYRMASDGSNLLVWVRSGGRYTFEPQGASRYRLSRVADATGIELNLNYVSNRLDSIATAASNVVQFGYSPAGYLTNVLDVTGNRQAVFSYTNDLLVQVTDMGGQTFKYAYDSSGRITGLSRPNLSGSFDTTTFAYAGSTNAAYTITVTRPEGGQDVYAWGGEPTSAIAVRNPLGGVVSNTPDWNYTWGQPIVETRDALGRITSRLYYDHTGNAAIDGKLKKQVDPDGAVAEHTYNAYGDAVTTIARDSLTNGLTVTTNTYTYFTNSWRIATQLTQIKDASGNLLSRRLAGYQQDDRGTTNLWDDVVQLAFTRDWYGTNASDYAERRYTYTTNFLPATEQTLVGPTTNDYRTLATYEYDGQNRLIARCDALTNKTFYAYDAVNRLDTETGYLNRGAPGTNDDLALVVRHFYDDLNRQTNLVYPDGIAETWDYAVCGCGTATHTDRGGNVTAYTYDHDKRLDTRAVTTSNGTLVAYARYAYDPAGDPILTFDAQSNFVHKAYDVSGALTETIDPLGRETSYLEDSVGRQFMTIYPDGTISSNTYDSASRLIKVSRYASDSRLLTSDAYSHDPLGRQVSATDALGNTTTKVFDMLGRTVKTILPDGSYSVTVYDLLGNVVRTIGPLAANASAQEKADATTVYVFDAINRQVAVGDSLGRTNTWEYDADHPSKVKYLRNANGQAVQENAYEELTGRLATNSAYGLTMAYRYDAAGQVLATLYPDGSSASSSYDGPRLVRQVSRTGVTNAFAYDSLNRRIAVTNGLGQAVRYAYDAAGQTTRVTDPLTNVTQFTYDAMGRQTRVIRPDGGVTTNAYDTLGRKVAKTGAGSVPAFYAYDALGRMTNLVDGVGNRTLFAYDKLGRLTKKTYPDNSLYRYDYNARGWLTNRTDAIGKSTGFTYTPVGQLAKVDYPTDTDIQYSYDTLGRQTNRTDSAGTWSWTYDGESSRVLSEDLTSDLRPPTSVAYTYAPNTFDLASVTCGASTTLYSWTAGRLTNVSWQAGPDTRSVRYAYKENSELLEETAFDAANNLNIRRSYDSADRLVNISATNSAGLINSFTYTLDTLGRRVARDESDSSHLAYSYDRYDQLTGAARTNGPNGAADAAYHFQYQYDEIGNRLHEDRGQLDLDGGFNALNQLTGLNFGGKLDIVGTATTTNPPVTVKVDGTAAVIFQGTNYWGGGRIKAGSNAISIVAYDASSNRTETLRRVTSPPTNPQRYLWDRNGNLTNDGQRAFFWNEENKLVAIESLAPLAKKRSEFLFDAQSRMVERKDLSGWNGTSYSTTNTTRYIRDGYRILAEITAVATNYHIWGQDLSGSLDGAGGIGGLLAQIRGTNAWLYTYDGNGNVVDLLQPALLDIPPPVVAHYEYDPFGRLVFSSGPCAASNLWQFSTKLFDPIWGILHYEFRPYSPNLHIWPSRDPIGERGGFNLYSFAVNCVPNYVDTDGRFVYPIIIRPPGIPPVPPRRGGSSECAELRKFIDDQRQIRDAYQKSIGTCEAPKVPFETKKLADPGMGGCFQIPNRFLRSVCIAHELCHWPSVVSLPVKIFCAKDKCERLDILAKEEVPCYNAGIDRGEELYKQYCSDPEPDGT